MRIAIDARPILKKTKTGIGMGKLGQTLILTMPDPDF